jgi:hypothetical protein
MAITKQSGRQELITASVDINLADVVTNVAAGAIDLPANAVLVGGALVTTEAWNSTTSDVMDVGDASSATRYVTDGNIRALAARVPLVLTGFVHTNSEKTLTVTWTSGGGTPTTGKVRLEVQYFVKGRSTFAQGLGQ